MPPADNRSSWDCPACKQTFHAIAGADMTELHAPHCAARGIGLAAATTAPGLAAQRLANQWAAANGWPLPYPDAPADDR